jgi:small nuclear ribonucleoprotein (snRNP)-like protein
VGNWLYGVAYHTALKARAAAVKRRVKEAQVSDMSRPATLTDNTGQDWQPVLDQELSHLPDKYREPIVLCDLEGKTRKEAARQLGVAEGTLSGRLTTAHRRLAQRLTRRGLTLSAGALAAILCQNSASAGVPAPLMTTTVQAAALLAGGETAAGVISAKVISLTEGVLKAMLMTKLKATAAIVMVLGLLMAGSGTLLHHALAGAPADRPAAAEKPRTPAAPEARAAREQPKDGPTAAGALQSVDAAKNTITITVNNRQTGKTEKTFDMVKDITVVQDGKAAKLSDLKPGGHVTLKLSADQKTVVGVTSAGATIQGPLKSVDAAKNTVTLTTETRQGKQDKTYQLAKDAKVTLDGKEAKLADLKEGTRVVLTMSVDGSTVLQVGTPSRRGGEGE